MSQTAQINIKIDAKQAQDTFSNLRKGISDASTQLDSIVKKYGQNSIQADNQRKVLAKLNIEYDTLAKSVTDLGARFDDVYQGSLPMTTRLGEIEDRLYELALAGDNASREFRDLMGEAGRLRQTIIQTDLSVDAMAMTMSQKVMGATQGLLGAFAAVQGTMGLMGVESEKVQETLLKVQSAMALIQGIDAFRQSLPSLKALGGSLVALIPTLGGAATASGGLAVAMNAIPFVAIVTGIGLAVTALASWIGKSKEATEAEKKRAEEQQKQKEATDSVVNSIASEGTELVMLLNQLKATNKGSKERKDIINTLNSQYGLTLKNLQDEKAFQDQVTQAVEDYITQLRNKVALQLVEQEMTKLLQRQLQVRGELDAATKSNNTNTLLLTKSQDGLNSSLKINADLGVNLGETLAANRQGSINFQRAETSRYNQGAKLSKEQMTRLRNEDNQLQGQLEGLGKKGLEYTSLLVGSWGKVSGGVKDTGKSQNDLNDKTDKYRKILDDIKSRLEREASAQQQLIELNTDRIKIQSEGEDEVFIKTTEYEQKLMKLKIDNDKFERQLIDNAIKREVEVLDERFEKGGMTEQQYIDNLNKIREGGYDLLLQSEKDLIDTKERLYQEDVDNLDEAEQLKITKAINSRQLLEVEMTKMSRDFQKEQEIREIENSKMTEEEKNKEILRIKKEYYDGDKYLLEQTEQEKLDIINQSEEQELDNINLSYQERVEIQKKYEKERLQLSQDTQNAINRLEDDSMVNFTQSLDERVNELATKVGEALEIYGGMFMDLFGGVNDLLSQLNENRINTLQQQNEVELANIQRQYDSRAITEEEYNALVIQQQNKTDEQTKALKRKQFQREKNYNIANAIMTGAIAVMNGLATMPLVPLGLIMAGVAGAMTGVQIATISQQQFTAARGGIVPGNGLPTDVDSVNAKLAPGEAVINSRSTAMFPQALSFINQAGGGVPLVPNTGSQGSMGSGVVFTENQQQPVRAYVVETEITDTQRRVGRIQRSVEF
jgi:hypothetical protein